MDIVSITEDYRFCGCRINSEWRRLYGHRFLCGYCEYGMFVSGDEDAGQHQHT